MPHNFPEFIEHKVIYCTVTSFPVYLHYIFNICIFIYEIFLHQGRHMARSPPFCKHKVHINNMQRRRHGAVSPSPPGVYFSLSAVVSLPEPYQRSLYGSRQPTLSLGSGTPCVFGLVNASHDRNTHTTPPPHPHPHPTRSLCWATHATLVGNSTTGLG